MKNTSLKSKSIFLWLSSLLVLMLIITTSRSWLSWFGVLAPLEKQQTALHLKDIQYNYPSPVFTKEVNLKEQAILFIALRFKIAELKDYMNLFQTAASNDGVRVELDKQGSMALVARSSVPGKLVMLQIVQPGKSLTLNVWHTLAISAWNHHLIQVKLDGIAMPAYFDSSLNFEVSNIQIGSGFAADRTFAGEITNFNLTTKVSDRKFNTTFNRILKIILIILSMIAASLLLLLGQLTLLRKQKIEYISLIVLMGFVVAVIFNYIMTYMVAYFSGNASDNYVFLCIGMPLGDFFIGRLTNLFLDPYHSTILPGEYFPFAYLLMYPFVLLNPNLGAFIFCLMFIVFMVYFVKQNFSYVSAIFSKQLASYKNIFILSIMTYPFLFNLERGNIENILFILVAVAIYCYQRHYRLGAVLCLAMASAVKLYPLLFITLFFSDKRYKEVFYTILLTVLLTVLGLWLLNPGFKENVSGVMMAMHGLNKNCAILPDRCVKFSVSLWGAIKYFQGNYLSGHVMNIKKYYLWAFSLLGLMVIYVGFVERIVWRKLAILVSAILLLPIISNDYKLIYLFLPLAFFVNQPAERWDAWYATLFALLLIPKDYYRLALDVSINDYINIVILLLFVLTIMLQRVGYLFFKRYK